jgi:chemotaxis protein CheD
LNLGNLKLDRIEETDTNGIINLPIGHYSIVKSRCKNKHLSPKLSIYGLGSCIALILCDFNKQICGMSHILLPKSTTKNINYPHKYANLSVKLLMKELISHGAEREHIRAIIIGGSKIFDLDNNMMGFENIRATKAELDSLKIDIIKEETGGSRGRIIIFDTEDLSLCIKSSGEDKYKKFKYLRLKKEINEIL